MKEYIKILEQLNAISDSELEGLLESNRTFEINTNVSFITLSYSVNLKNNMYVVRSLRWDKFGRGVSLKVRQLVAFAVAHKVSRVNVRIRNRIGGCYDVFNPVSIKNQSK